MHAWRDNRRDRSWLRPDRPPAHDDLDDAHHGTATAAGECRHWSEDRVVVTDRFRGRHIEQGLRFGQTGAALGIDQQSIMANAVEPAGQHMKEKRRMNSSAESDFVLCRVRPFAR